MLHYFKLQGGVKSMDSVTCTCASCWTFVLLFCITLLSIICFVFYYYMLCVSAGGVHTY